MLASLSLCRLRAYARRFPARSLGTDQATDRPMALRAPQSKPVAAAPRLVAQIAPLVAFGPRLRILAAGPVPTSTLLLFQRSNGNPNKSTIDSDLRFSSIAARVQSMTVAITVRDVPDGVRDELAARAARAGQSLQEYVRAMLVDAASRPSVADVIARARTRVDATGVQLDAASILAARDADRR
jgi:plasmid stability protein